MVEPMQRMIASAGTNTQDLLRRTQEQTEQMEVEHTEGNSSPRRWPRPQRPESVHELTQTETRPRQSTEVILHQFMTRLRGSSPRVSRFVPINTTPNTIPTTPSASRPNTPGHSMTRVPGRRASQMNLFQPIARRVAAAAEQSKPMFTVHCGHCSWFLSSRGMVAQHVNSEKTLAVSSDALSYLGVALVSTTVAGQVITSPRCCCLSDGIACLQCGNVIGYYVTQVCGECARQLNNGHQFIFDKKEVTLNQRIGMTNDGATYEVKWRNISKRKWLACGTGHGEGIQLHVKLPNMLHEEQGEVVGVETAVGFKICPGFSVTR